MDETYYTWAGRVWGFADEVRGFMRQMHRFEQQVVDAAIMESKPTRFRVTEDRTTLLGTRGWFNKRQIIMVEYTVTLDNEAQMAPVQSVVNTLTSKLLS